MRKIILKLFSILILLSVVKTNAGGPLIDIQNEKSDVNSPSVPDDFSGLKIIGIDEKSSAKNKLMIIKGVNVTFIRCGSQLAMWANFPREVTFHLREINKSKKYESIDMSISFSPDQSTVDYYSAMPCNKIVKQYFEVNIYNLIADFPQEAGVYEVYAKLINAKSDKINFSLNK